MERWELKAGLEAILIAVDRPVLVQTLRWLDWTVIMVQDESIGFVQGTAF